MNDDGVVFGGSDDAVVDDGCLGDPPQVGTFSEAQFNIGGNDQDPAGWRRGPRTRLVPVPNSINRITITDLTSFLGPVYRMNTKPGNANYDMRWDLVPGPTIGSNWIQLNDLTALLGGASGNPPMLGAPGRSTGRRVRGRRSG